MIIKTKYIKIKNEKNQANKNAESIFKDSMLFKGKESV